jgi:cation transport ATPase
MIHFTIKIKIEDDQMYCANCSQGIKQGILASSNDQAIEQLTVYTNYSQSLVTLKFKAADQNIAQQYVEHINDNISAIGYDVESHEIASLDSPLSTTAPLEDKSLSLAPKQSLAYSVPLILSGIFLSYLLKPLALLAQLSQQVKFWTYVAISIAATITTGHAGFHFYKNTLKAIFHLSHRAMDTLITLGTSVAILNGYLILFTPDHLGKSKDNAIATFGLPLMVLGFIKFSHGIRDLVRIQLEEQTQQLEDSESYLPTTACQYFDDETKEYNPSHTEELPVSEIEKHSIISVKIGEVVPIDGTLLSDQAIVKETYYGKKEATIKLKGEVIFAGSIIQCNDANNNINPPALLETLCAAADNHIRKAVESVNIHQQDYKKLLEVISQYFLITVCAISAASASTWGLIDQSYIVALEVLTATLLSACPCSFGLIDLLDSLCKILLFNENILLQNDAALSIHRYTDFVFDKGGTLTTDNYSFSHVDIGLGIIGGQPSELAEQYLAYAVILESNISKKDQNSIAKAILSQKINVGTYKSKDNFSHNTDNKGRGGCITIDNKKIKIGNKTFLEKSGVIIAGQWKNKASSYSHQDKLAIYMAIDNQVCCLVVLNNTTEQQQLLRRGAIQALNWLHGQGKKLHILTGDSHERTKLLLDNNRITLPIDIHADQTPLNKLNTIQELQQHNKKVVMIGDDRNDVAAMQQTLGLAIDHQAKTCNKDTAMTILNGDLISLVQLMQITRCYGSYTLAAIIVAFGSNVTALGIATGRLAEPAVTSSLMAVSSLLVGMVAVMFKMHGAHILSSVKSSAESDKSESSFQCNFFKSCFSGASSNKSERELRMSLISDVTSTA